MTDPSHAVIRGESTIHDLHINIKKTHPDAIIPAYANPGDACFDLHCIHGALMGPNENWSPEAKGRAVEFRTGLAFEIPRGFAMLIYSRSGHGFNHGVRLSNCVGVIDSGYRGEVKVKLHIEVDGPDRHYGVMAGDRIAQAMILPVPMVAAFRVVDALSETERGEGGFGSSGVSA